jgi:hypothetical protein
MSEEKPERRHLPKWAKTALIAISIIGPLTGAVVTATEAYYSVKAKAKDATVKTKASYETLAPAVKELQDLLSKALDASDAADREIVALKADRDEKEKRILRLEAYVDILGRQQNLPDAPPAVLPAPKPVTVARVRKFKPPTKPIPVDVGAANQYQQKRVDLMCAPNDPLCDTKAANMAAP